jgi:predicted  nucleic acid-binding Zn ribbon protein
MILFDLPLIVLQEVEKLREELHEHRDHMKHQEDWFNAENLRMKNKMLQQEQALKHQEDKVNNLQVNNL